MKNATHEATVRDYIAAYNRLDVDAMLQHMHAQVKFENISDGQVTAATQGLAALREQALQAKQYFAQREQKITTLTENGDNVEVMINYEATLATDLPNGMKAGDKISLSGRSVFTFQEGKIIALKDIS